MTESLYLISAVLFILALKLFSRPSTAFRANNLAIGGMVLAIISAFDLKFADYDIFFYLVILVSAGLGVLVSNRVQIVFPSCFRCLSCAFLTLRFSNAVAVIM